MQNFTTFNEFEEEILKINTSILLIFFANWCEPCKKIPSILHEIELNYGSKLKIIDIDAEKHPDISKHYSVKGYPTFLILKEGKVLGTKVGGEISKSTLSGFIDSSL